MDFIQGLETTFHNNSNGRAPSKTEMGPSMYYKKI